MQEYFHRPFPFLDPVSHRISLILFCGVFSIGFLWLFEPLGINSWGIVKAYDNKLPIFLFAGVGILFFSMSQIGVRKILGLESLTRGSFILYFLSEILVLSFTNFLLFGDLEEGSRIYVQEYLLSLKHTGLVLLIPYCMVILYFAAKDGRNTSESSNSESPPLPNVAQIHFKGDNQKEVLSVKIEHLLFLQSASNYVSVYYLYEDQVKKKLIRNSLKKLESEINHPLLIRTHRSYMVNLMHLISVKKTNKAYQLSMAHVHDQALIVSPNYMESFDARLEKLNASERITEK